MGTEMRIGVVGAGVMGGGIGQKLAMEGFPVVLCDIGAAQLELGMVRIRTLLDEGVERRALSPEGRARTLQNLHPTAELKEMADCGLVIEAVFEDLEVKKDLFTSLDAICPPATILATNTSSFLVADMAGGLAHPERVIGLHFFFHPVKNRLVEVIAGPLSRKDLVKRAWNLMAASGKTPIATRDAPGFCVNRFFVQWLNEAVRMVAEGMASIPAIEAAAKTEFRIGMGPFELMNVTGVSLAYHSSKSLADSLGDFYRPSPALKAQCEAAKPWALGGPSEGPPSSEIADRLFAVTWAVAGQILDEDVATLEDVDRGAKIGLRWSLGPFEWMNRRGVERGVDQVKALAAHHPQLKVARALEAQAAKGKPWLFRRVDFVREGAVAHLVINRPEALNALNQEVLPQLEDAFDRAAADDDVRGIVLRGAGKAFAAGVDVRFFVKAMETGRIGDIKAFTQRAQALFLKIASCAKPVTAVLHGLALGGGAELALTAHRILATRKGSIGFPETGIGICPALGGTFRTTRRMGPELARYLVLTGRVLDAQEAFDLGLVDVVVNPLEVETALREVATLPAEPGRGPRRAFGALIEAFRGSPPALLAEGFTASPPEVAEARKALRYKAPIAVRCALDLIDMNNGLSDDEAYANELKFIDTVFTTRDALAGLRSVGVERPVFKGE